MKKLGKKIIVGTSYIALSNAVGRAIAFVTIIIVTHALSLYEYGLITLALAITGPAFALMGLGLDQLIEADAARYLGDRQIGKAKQLLIEFYTMRGILLLIIVGVGWTWRSLLEKKYGPIVSDASAILMMYVVIQYVKTAYNTIMQTHQSFRAFAVMNGMEPVVRLLCVLGLVTTVGLSVSTVLATYVIAPLVMVILATPYMVKIARRYCGVECPQGSTLLSTMKAHGKWQSMLQIIGSITDNVKYFIIQKILSTEAVAIYSVAVSAYSAYANLVPLKTVLTPIVSQFASQRERLQTLMAKAAKYTIAAYAVIMIGGMLISPIIMHIFFPKYINSIGVLQLLMLRFPLNVSSIIHVPALKALREQKFLSALSLLNIVTMIAISVPLTYILGVYGMAIEMLVIVLAHAVLREWRLRRVHHIRTINLRAMFTYDDTDRYIKDTVVGAVASRIGRSIS